TKHREATEVRRQVAELLSSVADPRIEERVGNVNDQVDQHVYGAGEQDHGLDHGIVPRQDRIDGEAAMARDIEHALSDDNTADQERKPRADDGHDRYGCITEGVAEEDDPFLHAF